jgi:hypothetical protein
MVLSRPPPTLTEGSSTTIAMEEEFKGDITEGRIPLSAEARAFSTD